MSSLGNFIIFAGWWAPALMVSMIQASGAWMRKEYIEWGLDHKMLGLFSDDWIIRGFCLKYHHDTYGNIHNPGDGCSRSVGKSAAIKVIKFPMVHLHIQRAKFAASIDPHWWVLPSRLTNSGSFSLHSSVQDLPGVLYLFSSRNTSLPPKPPQGHTEKPHHLGLFEARQHGQSVQIPDPYRTILTREDLEVGLGLSCQFLFWRSRVLCLCLFSNSITCVVDS